ncbi:hypothetical protein DM02DRAFT_402634 [Periconia macrospinosa]|uniref:Uncharacterized protein n=1 Tax=Periconia macrospinosa TaxID=97972 RepID=A0A2V1CYI7_9PLEO|nr:hypothetical protein DM02DRAFT_402634 [Periconia macrospinosa]
MKLKPLQANTGAKHAFDYKFASVADDIIKALEGTMFLGVCDCIGTPDAAKAWTPVYKKLGGRYGSVLPGAEGLPEGIEGGSVFAASVALADKYIGEVVWAKYIPEALANGSFKAKPDPTVVGHGLEKIQPGMDKLKKDGASFTKYVVTL